MAQYSRRTTFDAGAVRFVVQHELWDGNIEDHSDQGVAILVTGEVGGEETTLLRFNCFDLERSYVYGPETVNKLCRMDPDRKSTRLNSSHANISYAVFCLKKKKKITIFNNNNHE